MKREFEGKVIERDVEKYSEYWYVFGDVTASKNDKYPEHGPFFSNMVEKEFLGKKVRITVEVIEE